MTTARPFVLDLVIAYGFQVLGALVVLGVGIVAARWLGRLTERQLARRHLEPPILALAVRAVKLLVLLLALVLALDKFGFQIAPLVAGIGVAGLGIGLALQGVLTNVVAGLTIVLTRPFRVGEYVAVAGVHGEVATIALFSTTLTHPDRSRIVIPNRKIVGEILHNFGTMRQLSLTVGVPHGADLSTALTAARAVLRGHPAVLSEPAPLVGVSEVTDLAVKIRLQPWVRVADVVTVEPALYEELIDTFRKRGIATPLRRHEVRLVDGPSARVT